MASPRVLKAQITGITCGENVTIIEPSNVYGCELKDDVFIGPFVEIQKNSVIGERSKIQSHTFICEYVTIGSDCFVGHGVMFANDLFKEGKPDPNPDSWGRTPQNAFCFPPQSSWTVKHIPCRHCSLQLHFQELSYLSTRLVPCIAPSDH